MSECKLGKCVHIHANSSLLVSFQCYFRYFSTHLISLNISSAPISLSSAPSKLPNCWNSGNVGGGGSLCTGGCTAPPTSCSTESSSIFPVKNPLFRLELLPNHALFRFFCVLPPEKLVSLLMTVYGDPGRDKGSKCEEALPFSVPNF